MQAVTIVLSVLIAGGIAWAQRHVPAPLVAPWVTTSCWVEPRWFESLRTGPIDYCKKSLRYRPGRLDCLTFTDEVCWAFNSVTGDYQQLRNTGRESLIICPEGPEPPTCPRLR